MRFYRTYDAVQYGQIWKLGFYVLLCGSPHVFKEYWRLFGIVSNLKTAFAFVIAHNFFPIFG